MRSSAASSRTAAASWLALTLVLLAVPCRAQQVAFRAPAAQDSAGVARAIGALARNVLARGANVPGTTFRLQMLAGDFEPALATIAGVREIDRATDSAYAALHFTQYEILARARLAQRTGTAFDIALRRAFEDAHRALPDRLALWVDRSFVFPQLAATQRSLAAALTRFAGRDSLPLTDAVELCGTAFLAQSYGALAPWSDALIAGDRARRYRVDTVRVHTSGGATVAAVIARPLSGPKRLPAVLEFTIYAGPGNREVAIEAAAYGYAGVVANTRGKRSAGPVWPFEHDGEDADTVIAWIARQPWSDGQVGMHGGSYDGFAQWAAAKHLPRALRTIVPAVAVVPGFDTPAEGGVFQSYHYAWIPYVTNGPLLDDAANDDFARWARLDSLWYTKGLPWRSLDSLDGKRSPVFQRWLDHPEYDAYWQAMVPQGAEYARIGIPVLTITGYFDGAQIGALHYMKEHLARRPDAPHYLLIGPWDHFGSQGRPAPVIAGYRIDPAARVDVTRLIYQWMDHVLKSGPLPALLADRVNFEEMGADAWRHAPSLERMSDDTLTFHLDAASHGRLRTLVPGPGRDSVLISRTVDFADRTVATDNFIHDPLADTTLVLANGVAFASAPLPDTTTVCGSFLADLRATIDRRDMDVGVQLLALGADGRYTQLACFLGRASLMHDRAHRRLLRPGTIETLPIRDTRMVCTRLAPGTRLVLVLNVNQSPHEQVNHGSGRPVSDESIADAGGLMHVVWHGSSWVKIPIRH